MKILKWLDDDLLMGIPFCHNQWFSVYSNKDDLSDGRW